RPTAFRTSRSSSTTATRTLPWLNAISLPLGVGDAWSAETVGTKGTGNGTGFRRTTNEGYPSPYRVVGIAPIGPKSHLDRRTRGRFRPPTRGGGSTRGGGRAHAPPARSR